MEQIINDFYKAWTTLDSELITKHLAPSFVYDSQWVLCSLDCRGYKEYIAGKFKTLKEHGITLTVSIVDDPYYGGKMLRIIQDERRYYYRIRVEGGKVVKGDLCMFKPNELKKINSKDPKNVFISLLRTTGREGVEDVIEELETLGFFEAPASARFHLNEEGGLVAHSLNVCNVALKVREVITEKDFSLREALPLESVLIATLLHDVCKADIYKKAVKKQKNKFGIWVEVPGYDVVYDTFPMGHGEKSLIVLQGAGLQMTDDEMLAIRWHMSTWDLPFPSPDIKGNLNAAKDKCPLLSLVQAADGLASGILERK